MSGVLASSALGVALVVGAVVAWVAVQVAWRRAFPADGPDPDALAGRPGCGGCGCAGPEACRRSPDPFPPPGPQEDLP